MLTANGRRQQMITAEISVLSNERRSSSLGLPKYFQHDTSRRPNIRGTFRIVRSIRIVRARLEPERFLRAYNDRLIVRNWEGIKRAESMSKVETLRFETWLFDERIRRADELGVALDHSGKWFDRFVYFFRLLYVYDYTICFILNLSSICYMLKGRNRWYLIFRMVYYKTILSKKWLFFLS